MRRAALLLLVTLAALPFLPARAATPDSGTVSPTATTITYQGAEVGDAPPALNRRVCTDRVNCDSFALTVEVPEGFYPANSRVLSATITWTDPDADLDLWICRGTASSNPQCLSDLVASSTRDGTTTETVVVANPAPGAYRVLTGSASGRSSYQGKITLLAPPQVAKVAVTSGAFSWDAKAVSNASPFAEPSVDVDHAGRIFLVAPGGGGVQMWRSFDGGASFDQKAVRSNGGGGDAEIEFLPDDTAFTADLRVEDSAVSRSTDHFDTWTQQSVGIEQDRQWLAHRCGDVVYLGYHDFVVEAEMINSSRDGGETWDDVPVLISPPGTAPGNQDEIDVAANQGVNTFSGPVVVDQATGDVYIVFGISTAVGNVVTGIPPFGEPTQIVVGYSHDEGRTFRLKLVKRGGVGSLAGPLFPWITLDRDGTVYVSWAGRDTEDEPIDVFMAFSTDHAVTWSDPYRVNTDAAGNAHIYPTVSAGDPGVVDVAWYTASTPDPGSSSNEWYVDFAQVRSADTPTPQISQSRVYDQSIHHGEICLRGILCVAGGDRSLLDFFQIQVGPDGMANIAFANNATPDGTLRVWYARQTAGPSAGNALHDSAHCSKAPAVVKGTISKKPNPLPATGVGTRLGVALVLLGAAAAVAGRIRRVRI